MKRLAVLLAAVAVLLPGAAHAAACSPLNCAPSQFALAHGGLLAVRGSTTSPLRVVDLASGETKWRLPAGIVENGTLVSKQNDLLTWYDLASGARTGDATIAGRWALVGASQDGARAVLARTQKRSTSFEVVARGAPAKLLKLGGNRWEFDALSGSNLFLILETDAGYYVRLYDLAANTLVKQPLKGPGENALISGAPFARVASPDGRYLFTLYVGGDGGAMIHELDLTHAKAICIGLPGGGDFGAATTWALAADPDGQTLWAISPGYGRVVAIDVPSHRVRRMWEFNSQGFNLNAPGTAVLSPDGAHFAVSDARHIWFMTLAEKLTVYRVDRVATAIGWAPDQSALWVVGEGSRVSRLQPRW